ncbi:hypothetical protein BRAO375_1270030 [Bradyrhizobium sp. ORS 375]|uniref:hypothetical protein n=1 Tax=Bradyrhizobium sp. (strain ORS 375) TaxID=566679 RepID=UPI0002408AC8|nr:hypothetical protein [Bradyrhizobium sp. ORS 375]CCD90953.1 hypothetical protein BRAO375_1270030 [Bradyrhizobium sp. ORS 375]
MTGRAALALEDWLAELLKQAGEWDYEQIGYLLAQVQEAGGTVPGRYFSPAEAARTERTRLGRALALACAMELVDEEFKSDMRWERRIERLWSIETKANSILDDMGNDPILRLMATTVAPDRRTSDDEGDCDGSSLFESLKSSLQLVARRASSARKLLEEFGRAGGFEMDMDGPSKQSTLIQSLDSIYEEYLDGDPLSGIVKTYNKPGGPFVAFVRAVYHVAMRPEMSDATLYKALQRAGLIGQTDKA